MTYNIEVKKTDETHINNYAWFINGVYHTQPAIKSEQSAWIQARAKVSELKKLEETKA